MATTRPISRRQFLSTLGLAGLTLAAGRTGFAQAPAKPRNLVFILIDDMRFDAMGFMNPYYETPHMDQLAANGMVFENCFVTRVPGRIVTILCLLTPKNNSQEAELSRPSWAGKPVSVLREGFPRKKIHPAKVIE